MASTVMSRKKIAYRLTRRENHVASDDSKSDHCHGICNLRAVSISDRVSIWLSV